MNYRRAFHRIHGELMAGVTAAVGLLAASPAAANLAVWDSENSLVDATDYSSLGPFYWFANFGADAAQTSAAANANEARNLPSWIRFETDPAFIGKDDSGLVADTNNRTGFSLEENSVGTAGSTSTGGQAGFNDLTLPGGAVGRSGEVVATVNQLGNTSSFAFLRILPGAPSSFRIWVITDNGAGAGFQDQARIRVNLRDTNGPPTFGADANVSEAEALPDGVRIGQTAVGHNGTADAWAFNLSSVDPYDILIIRPTSAASSFPAFAGFIITPEPGSAALLAIGTVTLVSRMRSSTQKVPCPGNRA